MIRAAVQTSRPSSKTRHSSSRRYTCVKSSSSTNVVDPSPSAEPPSSKAEEAAHHHILSEKDEEAIFAMCSRLSEHVAKLHPAFSRASLIRLSIAAARSRRMDAQIVAANAIWTHLVAKGQRLVLLTVLGVNPFVACASPEAEAEAEWEARMLMRKDVIYYERIEEVTQVLEKALKLAVCFVGNRILSRLPAEDVMMSRWELLEMHEEAARRSKALATDISREGFAAVRAVVEKRPSPAIDVLTSAGRALFTL